MLTKSIVLVLLIAATAALASSPRGRVAEQDKGLHVSPYVLHPDPIFANTFIEIRRGTHTTPGKNIKHSIVLKCERSDMSRAFVDLPEEFRLHHAAYKLSRRGVLPIYELVNLNTEYGEKQCLSMAYAPNGDVFKLMEDAASPMPELLVKILAYRMALVLETLHSNRIVHRDIRPQNIVMMDDGSFKLMDFGHAVRLDDPSHAARLQSPPGTEEYGAPEYANDQLPSNQRPADIYGLAMTILELLVFPEYMHEPSWFRGKVSRTAYNLIENMTRKDPDQRYTIQDVLKHPWLKSAADNVKDNSNLMTDMKKVATANGYSWDTAIEWLKKAKAVMPQEADVISN